MSRDISHDPQDTRSAPPSYPVRHHRSSPRLPSGDSNSLPEVRGVCETTDARGPAPHQNERNDLPRAYYFRDRAYRLRDSEMCSLREIGKFRVVQVVDLAKHVYGGDRDRMERDIRRLARQSL